MGDNLKKIKTGKVEHPRGVRQYRFNGAKPLLLLIKGEHMTVDPGDEIEIDSHYMKTPKLRTQFTEVTP